MQAASLVQKASSTPSPTSATSPISGILNGRHCTSTPAVSPRITCHSRWWNVLTQGGIKGWYNWRVAVQKFERLSVAERLDKPVRAAAAIFTALRQAAINKTISSAHLNDLIKEAHWYGVDADKEIHSAFLKLERHELNNIKNACEGKELLAWLIRKIDRKTVEIDALGEKLKDGIYRSAMSSTEGVFVNGHSQKEFWEKMDQSFESVGSCHLKELVKSALSKNSAWNLLPFAELQLKGVAVASKVLEQTCIQAWEKLSGPAVIDFKKLTNSEFDKFSVMADHTKLRHHASAFKLERERRTHIVKCEKLAAHLEKRVQSLVVSPSLALEMNSISPDDIFFDGLSPKDIANIALKVIVQLKLTDVLKISNLKSELLADMWLTEIAKAQLETPSVAFMGDAVLIDYLKSAECEKLPANAFARIEAEAGKRAERVYQQGYARLQAGLQSDSCNELVRAVLEFSARFKLAAQLDDAADLDDSRKKLPASFTEMLAKLLVAQKSLVRNLVLELRNVGQKEVADHLSPVIQELRGAPLALLPAREKQLVANALSQYVPTKLAVTSQVFATPSGIELGGKFLDLFEAYILNDDDSRRVMTAEDKELPVCAQFVKDQRSSNLQVEGQPVFNRHIPSLTTNDTKRAEEFVNRMRALKGISDEQIMTASQIANQSLGAVLKLLTRDEKLFSLTDTEADSAGVNRDGWGLMPAHPDHQENFVFNKDKSLTAHVRIFRENVESWSGESSGPGESTPITVETDPEESSFLAELKFEIDSKGIIQDVIFGNLTFERSNVQKVPDTYGKS